MLLVWCRRRRLHDQAAAPRLLFVVCGPSLSPPSGEALTLKRHHRLFTHLLPYDYPDFTLSSGEGVAVLRTAQATAGQYAESGPPPRTACALRCRSLAPDRGGDCRGILQHQQFDDNAAAEVPEYRGSDHKGLDHGVMSTGINYGLN
jgi:hypothetical protein